MCSRRRRTGRRRTAASRGDRWSYGGVQAVGADQQVAGRGGAVGEMRGDAVGTVLDGDEPCAVPDGDAPARGLGLERGVEVAAAQAPVAQERVGGLAHGRVRQLGACVVHDPQRGQRKAEGRHRRGGVQLGQGAHAVARQGEERADVLGRVRMGLVHGGLEACLVQRQSRRRTGDAPADDQYACHTRPVRPASARTVVRTRKERPDGDEGSVNNTTEQHRPNNTTEQHDAGRAAPARLRHDRRRVRIRRRSRAACPRARRASRARGPAARPAPSRRRPACTSPPRW